MNEGKLGAAVAPAINMWPGSNFQRPPYYPYNSWSAAAAYRMPFPMYSAYPPMQIPAPVPQPSEIPLPDGPPPPTTSSSPTPPTPSVQTTPVRPMGQSAPGPIRFNLNQAKFTPFNIHGKKKKKKKNNGTWMGQNSPVETPAGSPGVSATEKVETANSSAAITDWPASLNDYVNRAYATCEADLEKDLMGILLKGKITTAIAANELFTRDWDNEPLPVLSKKFQINNIQQQAGPANFKARVADRLGANRNYRGTPKSRLGGRQKSRSSSRSRSRSSSEDGSRKRSRSPSEEPQNFTPKRNTPNKKKRKKNKGALTANHNGNLLGSAVAASEEKLQQRAARFTHQTSKSGYSRITYEVDTEGDFDESPDYDCHVVGTCTDLEKPFLRLTTAPDPSQVRPVHVLRESLAHVVRRWAETLDYHYTCEQLKSIRQDLTVQGIRDEFAMSVYETHARICLEKGDPEEFNQCQTQLRMLYTELNQTDRKNEFTAYRILYFLYTNNTQDLTTIIGSVTPEEKADSCISHALKVAHTWYTNNYHKFFALYRNAPKMAGLLMKWFLERERKTALKTIIKAYRQTIPVVLVADKLGFDSVDEFVEFAKEFDLNYAGEGSSLLDCKESVKKLSNI